MTTTPQVEFFGGPLDGHTDDIPEGNDIIIPYASPTTGAIYYYLFDPIIHQCEYIECLSPDEARFLKGGKT